jgi:hypothetical protein
MMRGARNEEDDQFLRLRKWANKAFNLGANLAFRREGLYVTDSVNGFRVITRAAARKLKLDASDYRIESQMRMRAFKHRLRTAEFPTLEHARVAGETQTHSIPTGFRLIRAIWSELRRPPVA